MDGPDVFSELADLAAQVRAMRDGCDRVADVLWAVAALLREADAARQGHRPVPPTARHQPIASVFAPDRHRTDRSWNTTTPLGRAMAIPRHDQVAMASPGSGEKHDAGSG